ncbi:MAG TPA: hypothetical protein PLB95_05610 [Syntrophales bacterium]|nr:hypothetical protein [Syntrophorhabdus sp.]HOH27327.1 hypothetical protein [Syntrophorhabdus sp.]HOQ42939.1 hypothetical protein [Smithellaceae bacterium]HPX81351.1 hypothetical protein [Syntrophales bacterium]
MIEVSDVYFKRLKIVAIIFYSLLLFSYSIKILPVSIRNPVLMVWAVSFTISGFLCLYYIWQSAKLLGRKPLYYVFVAIAIPLIGVGIIYFSLRKDYIESDEIIQNSPTEEATDRQSNKEESAYEISETKSVGNLAAADIKYNQNSITKEDGLKKLGIVRGKGWQKPIIITTMLAMFLMGIFPHWIVKYEGMKVNRGYSFILSPPVPAAEIDITRFVVQWVLATLLACTFLYIFKSKNGHDPK